MLRGAANYNPHHPPRLHLPLPASRLSAVLLRSRPRRGRARCPGAARSCEGGGGGRARDGSAPAPPAAAAAAPSALGAAGGPGRGRAGARGACEGSGAVRGAAPRRHGAPQGVRQPGEGGPRALRPPGGARARPRGAGGGLFWFKTPIPLGSSAVFHVNCVPEALMGLIQIKCLREARCVCGGAEGTRGGTLWLGAELCRCSVGCSKGFCARCSVPKLIRVVGV